MHNWLWWFYSINLYGKRMCVLPCMRHILLSFQALQWTSTEGLQTTCAAALESPNLNYVQGLNWLWIYICKQNFLANWIRHHPIELSTYISNNVILSRENTMAPHYNVTNSFNFYVFSLICHDKVACTQACHQHSHMHVHKLTFFLKLSFTHQLKGLHTHAFLPQVLRIWRHGTCNTYKKCREFTFIIRIYSMCVSYKH